MKSIKRIIFFSLIYFGIIFGNISNAGNWNLTGVTIISRAERGADESIRFRSTPRPTNNNSNSEMNDEQIKAENIINIRNTRMDKNFPLEWKYEESNLMFGTHYLIYPDYFNHHKNKIIIHHTAGDYNPNRTIDDVKKEIQSIYEFHTIERDFGDIGYNFLIDQMGNIYEGRSGGEGAVGMHASNNNISSIGIALMGNFQYDKPTVEQMSALVNLVTAVARFYHIDPQGYTYTFSINTDQEPYVVATKNPNIMGHKHVKNTLCPGINLEKFLPLIREEVLLRMKRETIGESELPSSWMNDLKKSISTKNTTTSNTINSTNNTVNSTNNTVNSANNNSTTVINDFPERIAKIQKENPAVLQKLADITKQNYKGKLTKATNQISKIEKKYTITDIKKMINQNISVLLYELTTDYDSFEIACDNGCIFTIDGINYKWTKATLTFLSNTIQIDADRKLSTNNVSVKSSVNDGVVKIANYNRKSYVGTPWNIFKGSLSFKKGIYPLLNWEQKSDFIVVNTLPFSEYMKGIVETNDTESLEKNTVMAMISKNYALFYLNKENTHPNIPYNTDYVAIDDSRFFQKYVGAGLEKTLTKRYQALEETKNQVILYEGYLPILPYFNCSAGFTLSAEEKRGWNDTPYLKSVYDFYGCKEFAGHGVGLSGKGAERLAQQGLSYKQILQYYYSGITIQNIN